MSKRVPSVRPPPAPPRPKNRLLACLSQPDYQRLQPHLRTVRFKLPHVFHRRNEPIRDVYFLNGGMASMTMVMKDGRTVEIATIGDEGLIGMGAYFGAALIGSETMLQVPDTDAEVMSVAAFRKQLARGGRFAGCVQRYSQGLLRLMMQSTACVALHPVQDRCCRWLLMTHDRVRRDEFHLSHEFMAMMLGSTRPTVTVVARGLQKAGLIKYTHGRITIVDRLRLEAASCECYRSVKEQFDRLGL